MGLMSFEVIINMGKEMILVCNHHFTMPLFFVDYENKSMVGILR